MHTFMTSCGDVIWPLVSQPFQLFSIKWEWIYSVGIVCCGKKQYDMLYYVMLCYVMSCQLNLCWNNIYWLSVTEEMSAISTCSGVCWPGDCPPK
jgi:hypothetical protein